MLRNNSNILLLFISLMIWIISCPSETGPPDVLPAGVKIKPHGNDTLRSETGIQADANTNGIRIEWSPIYESENIITEYRIFRSVSFDSAFKQIGNIAVLANLDDSSFVDPSQGGTVGQDSAYLYYVIAVDSRDNESDTSEYFKPLNRSDFIQSFQLSEKSNPIHPASSDTGITGKPVFSWCVSIGGLPIRYIVRVGVRFGNVYQTIWMAQKAPDNYDGCQSPPTTDHLTFHNFSYTLPDTLDASGDVRVFRDFDSSYMNGSRLNKGSYYWRVDCDKGQNYKSKSAWTLFTVTRD